MLGWSSLKPGFWIGFLSFFPNQIFFCLNDSGVDVADMWAGNLFGNVVDSDKTGIVVDSDMSGNLVDSG